MLDEISPLLVAETAASYVKYPRSASDELGAIVGELRAIQMDYQREFDTVRRENLIEFSDRVQREKVAELSYNREKTPEEIYSTNLTWGIERDSISPQARSVAAERCQQRINAAVRRATTFCRAIDLAIKVNQDLFELVEVFRIRSLVAHDCIPAGHAAWWERVFRCEFKYVEASYQTFAERVEFDELMTSNSSVVRPIKLLTKTDSDGSNPKSLQDGPDAELMVLVLGEHEFGPFTATQFDVVELMWNHRESVWSESSAFFAFHQKLGWDQTGDSPFGKHQTDIKTVFVSNGFELPWKRLRGAFVWRGLVKRSKRTTKNPKAKQGQERRVSRSKKR